MNLRSIEEVDFENYFWTRSANDVAEIVKPLQKYGITFFSQSRLYESGVDDCLSNEPLTQKVYMDLKMWEYVFIGNPDEYVPCVIRWDDIDPENRAVKAYFAELRNTLDIANGIIIVKTCQKQVEFYYFASTASNYKINSFYLNNLDVLYNFIAYFNDVGEAVKKDSYDHRIFYPNASDKTILTGADVSCFYNQENSSEKTFSIISDCYRLTKRERQCAKLLTLGLSCKGIANQLNLSSKTVEKHLQNLRRKTNSRNFSQMFSKLYGIKK